MNKTKAFQNVKPSKFTIWNNSHTEILRQVEFTLPWRFLVYMQNLKVKHSAKSGRIVTQKHPSFYTWQLENKILKTPCSMNEQQPNSQEHQDCSGWQRRKTTLPWVLLKAPERISEQALICSLNEYQFALNCWNYVILHILNDCYFLVCFFVTVIFIC